MLKDCKSTAAIIASEHGGGWTRWVWAYCAYALPLELEHAHAYGTSLARGYRQHYGAAASRRKEVAWYVRGFRRVLFG